MSIRRKIRNIIGPAVARFRNARGWSQTTLAAKCQLAGWDISRSIVAAIEGGLRWVGDWEVAILANVLKISVADLMAHGAGSLGLIKKSLSEQRPVKAWKKPGRRKRAKHRRRG